MSVTDPRTRIGDSDSDGIVADVRTSDPASDTPGVVVRIAGTVGSAPAAGSATEAKQDDQIALATDGTQQAIIRGGAKGATVAATITSSAQGADHQGADVVEQFAPGYEDGVQARAVTLSAPISTGEYAYSGVPFSGVASGVIAASAANMLACAASNVSGAGLYFKIFNKATVPSVATETATLLHHVYVASGSTAYVVTFPSPGKYGSLGLAFIWATTPGATTNTAPADATTLSVSPEYK